MRAHCIPIALLLCAPSPLIAKAAAPDAAAPLCRDAVPARITGGPLRARPLGEMPPADLMLTVLRTENGCSRPVRVRQDIGAPARRPR